MSIVRATYWSNLGEAIQLRNVFTYRSEGYTLDTTSKSFIHENLSNLFTALLGDFSTVWAGEGTHFEELTEGVWQPQGEIAGALAGTATGELLPFMNSALILAYTGFAKTIGKKFLGGFTEAANLDGALVSTVVTHLTSALGYYLAVIDTAGHGYWVPGTVSATGVFHPFISGLVNDLFATQRRRHPGVGI